MFFWMYQSILTLWIHRGILFQFKDAARLEEPCCKLEGYGIWEYDLGIEIDGHENGMI